MQSCGYAFDHNTGDIGVPMKYIALLRAINVGGTSLMRMSDVRACDGVVYMSTFIARLTKRPLRKIVRKPIYRDRRSEPTQRVRRSCC